MKKTNFFSLISMIYLIIFLIDTFVELFQINASKVITTVMGLEIKVSMTKEALNSHFALTWKVLATYLLFMISCSIIRFVFKKISLKQRTKLC
ncbi:hypothetical protein SAMN05216431_10955 [Ligilactobacillus sp. WC1T17]|uniref:Uncharacterized protein n=1 Tax=Ligilactobacillus ruminis TaxID=1623 RepID=A0ABY1ACJ5_9LACO|nr:hypothetical protein SAMN05216431_10955 [Ligilactobacillus ruminis]